MSGQSTVKKNLLRGFPGQHEGNGHLAKSYVNDTGSSRLEFEVTIDTAAAATYTVVVEGIDVTYVATGADTVTTIRDGLLAAYKDNQLLEDVATSNPRGLDKLVITGNERGVAFTVTENSLNMSLVQTPGSLTAPTPIPFGRAVVRGTTVDDSAVLPSAAAQEFVGVVARVHSDVDPLAPTDSVAPFKKMSAVYQGLMLVEVEEAVAAGDPVFFRHTAGAGGTKLGVFRNDADTATADQITGAKFETSTTSAGLAVISLNGA